MRVAVARLTPSTGCLAKSPAEVIGFARGRMAFAAVGLGVRAAQGEACPPRVIELFARHVTEAVCGVTARTTDGVAEDRRHARVVEGTTVGILVTRPAVARRVVKCGHDNARIIGRRNNPFVWRSMAAIAPYCGMRTG